MLAAITAAAAAAAAHLLVQLLLAPQPLLAGKLCVVPRRRQLPAALGLQRQAPLIQRLQLLRSGKMQRLNLLQGWGVGGGELMRQQNGG